MRLFLRKIISPLQIQISFLNFNLVFLKWSRTVIECGESINRQSSYTGGGRFEPFDCNGKCVFVTEFADITPIPALPQLKFRTKLLSLERNILLITILNISLIVFRLYLLIAIPPLIMESIKRTIACNHL